MMRPTYSPLNALSRAAISSFVMCIMASNAQWNLASSGSLSISTILLGTTCLDRTTCGKFFPIIIHLFLGLTFELERNRFREAELRSCIESREALALQFKHHGQHCSLTSTMNLVSFPGVMRNLRDPRIFEDGNVIICSVFGLTVEPKAGRDCGEPDRSQDRR
jgi:hypothetical protein